MVQTILRQAQDDIRVRDSSGKPGAQRGLATDSPTRRGTPKFLTTLSPSIP